MKKSTILKSLGLKSNSSTTSLLKKTMQITAFTFSCLVALPSFVQTADAQTELDPIDVWGDPIDDPWGDWDGWVDDDWGCQSIGCDSSDDGGDGGGNSSPPPPTCSGIDEATLRNLKQNTPGCYGDPGPHFDTAGWFATETGSFWNYLNNPIGLNWYSTMLSPLTWLANSLDQNNGNQTILYSQFESQMWSQVCTNVWGGVVGDVNDSEHVSCLYSVYYVLESYYPGTNVSASITNWLLGTSFSTVEYDQTWGSRLTQDVQNFATCRAVYRSWEELACNGSL